MISATGLLSTLAAAACRGMQIAPNLQAVNPHAVCIGTKAFRLSMLSDTTLKNVEAGYCSLKSHLYSTAAGQQTGANSRPPEDTQARNTSQTSSTGNIGYQNQGRSAHNAAEAQDEQAPTGSISNSGSSGYAQIEQQQQQATEQLLSELFDAELEQRLMTAAAVAAPQQTSSNSSSSTTAASAPFQQSVEQQYTPTSKADLASLAQLQQQQHQQQRFQPGVVPTAPPAYRPPSGSSSSSSSRPSQVSRWDPLSRSAAAAGAAADPWAPIPGPGVARKQLPAQLAQLLQQAGVPQHLATAAVAAFAAAVPDTATSSNSTSSIQQQQQQHRVHAAADLRKVFNRLRSQQLVHLLEDCQAPTYGSKDLLISRVLLLLREQAVLQQQQQQQQQQGNSDPSDVSVNLGVRLGTEAVQDDILVDQQSQAQVIDTRQQQQRVASRHQQVAVAAAAARQQLLDQVVDVSEIGGWLMAARAQDVCVINVRGQAGLHDQIVIGTGLSQRHAHACAEAVAWQIKEKTKQLVQQQQQQDKKPTHRCIPQQQQQQEEEVTNPGNQGIPQQQQQQQQQQRDRSLGKQGIPQQQQQQQIIDVQSSLNSLISSLRVLGDPSSDWVVLDTGRVVVHVLTERARRFYNLEGLWGGPQGRYIQWMRHDIILETKDTIGRDMRA